MTENNPYLKTNKKIPNNVKTTPISDIHTFLVHIDGHNALENGFIGQKWFEVPYLIPPVLPVSK